MHGLHGSFLQEGPNDCVHGRAFPIRLEVYKNSSVSESNAIALMIGRGCQDEVAQSVIWGYDKTPCSILEFVVLAFHHPNNHAKAVESLGQKKLATR